MDRATLAERMTGAMESLPGQLGTAARYVLENPGDVALLSMREQARRAGVQPWTMTRLAKRFGLEGYEAIRELHGQALKEQALGFAGRAGVQVARQREAGGQVLAREIAAATSAQVSALGDAGAADALAQAALAMARARRVWCLGLRSSRPVAEHLAYMLNFIGEKAALIDFGDGTGVDALRFAVPDDIVFVVTVAPYTKATVDAVRQAHSKGLPIIVLTDGPASPVARLAQHTIFAGTESPSFFHTMTPAFTAAEILAALVAGEGGEAALEAITRTERQLSELKVHVFEYAAASRQGKRS